MPFPDPTSADAGDEVECSVLVPVLNAGRHIERALGSMRRQQFNGRIELLLIDGGSIDGTRELIAAHAHADPRVRLLENPAGATPVALNIGLRHARGRWVARMDAHSEYPLDYLQQAVERLRRCDTRWVSGPMVPAGDNTVSRATALAIGTWVGSGATRRWAAVAGSGGEYELDSGVFCGAWPREALVEVGGWDERWLRNQDSEMAARFLARGERLVCLPEMAAVYAPRGSLRALWRQYRQYGRYREKTAVRHPHTLRRSHLLAPGVVLAGALAVAGPARIRGPARAGVGSYAVAITATGVSAWRRTPRPDAALTPAVLVVMHIAHGVGFWQGVLRDGPPLAALARAAGLPRLGARLIHAPEPVYAPSLAVP